MWDYHFYYISKITRYKYGNSKMITTRQNIETKK